MKVLVVEDSMTDRVIIEALLQDIGHDIQLAETGTDAIAITSTWAPDIILLDVLLPDMKGTEVAQVIRSQNADDWIPIIFLSSRISPDDIFLGIASGGDDYLAKPVDEVILKAKMIAMDRISGMRQRLLDVSLELAKVNDELQKLVGIDGLTGIPNRRQLEHHFGTELSRCLRFGQHITVMLIDVDYFKLYNDHYGHLSGDDSLKAIAAKLDNLLLRSSDFVARYGGEEFAVILHGNCRREAFIVAEKLRQGIYDLCLKHAKSPYGRVTISLGLSVKVPDKSDSFESVVQEADNALYEAKNKGRNTLSIFSPSEATADSEFS